jgi:c-di-GMP-binding flagellar brake protein YcgR
MLAFWQGQKSSNTSFQTMIGGTMKTANKDYQEKRNFIRMKIETPAQVELQEGTKSFQGICRDLSGGGMLVELDTALPVGSKVKVQIASGHGHSPMLEALTEVARVVAQPGAEATPCLLGLEIKEVLS